MDEMKKVNRQKKRQIINIINISPRYTAIWKYGFYLFESLKKINRYDVRFIDLWEKNIVSHNVALRAFQLINGLRVNTKNYEINLYTTPLLANSIKKNDSKQDIVMIHDLYPIKKTDSLSTTLLTRYIYPKSSSADIILTNSEYTSDEYIRMYGQKNKLHRIYLGLDDIFINNNVKRTKNRHDKSGIIRLISVGREEPRKNLSFMIEVMHELDKRKISFHMIRIGRLNDANMRLIKVYGLKDSITIKESITEKELLGYYNQSDILLLPSLSEGFGLPVLEAMSCGCIPLCSDTGSLPEIVSINGLCLGLDVKKWSDAVIKFGKRNPMLIKRMKDHSKKFTWKNHALELMRIIEKRQRVKETGK